MNLFLCYETYHGNYIIKCFIVYLLFIQIYRGVLFEGHKMASFRITTLLQ